VVVVVVVVVTVVPAPLLEVTVVVVVVVSGTVSWPPLCAQFGRSTTMPDPSKVPS